MFQDAHAPAGVNGPRRPPAWSLPLSAAPTLSGCAGPHSALDPAGPAAADIAALWWVMFWASAALFALVISLLMLTILKPGFGSRFSPRGWIVAGGLVMPAVILTLLVVFAFAQGERLLFPPGAERPMQVEAQGRQWSWRFAYPEFPGVPPTVGVLRIPAGRTIEVVASSADVIHSFWIPRLGGKVDAIPGHRTTIRLRADRPGVYRGLCSEFCGDGHTVMRFVVEAFEPAEYEARLRAGEGEWEAGAQ